MKKYSSLLILLLITIVLPGCKSNSTSPENESLYEWSVITATEAGLNETLINEGMTAAQNTGFVNGIVIVKNGKICAERYFNGRDLNSYQSVRSVSKSFLSALIGIAVDKGLLNLDQKFVDFFPEYKTVPDQRFNNITLRHLLTMRSGIKGDEEIYFNFTGSSNWVSSIANTSLAFEPGTQKLYSTAGTHLISVILTKVTGMSSRAFCNANLLDPMKLAIKNWLTDPQGIYFGGNDMYFTTRDIAALGVLYMNKGNLNGRQIVPESWVNSSIVYNTTSAGTAWGSITKIGYGYLWWSGEIAGKQAFFALGHGGQYIMCIPALNMIIATTSYPDGDWSSADAQERRVNEIIAAYFIPSANSTASKLN